MNNALTRTLLTASLTLAASLAQASPVKLTGFSQGYENIDTSLSDVLGVGQFKGTINLGGGVQEFLTFCTDIYQPFTWNTTYQHELVANGSTYGFTLAQADLLGKLYTVAGAIDSTTKSVAFQLSIWEILYDTNRATSLTSGTFYLQSGGSQAVRAQATSWLASLSNVTSEYQVQRLYNASAQDFILAQRTPQTPRANDVPEPGTWALGGIALAAMLAARGRKARRR